MTLILSSTPHSPQQNHTPEMPIWTSLTCSKHFVSLCFQDGQRASNLAPSDPHSLVFTLIHSLFLHYSSADQYDQQKVVEVMYIASKSQDILWLLSSVLSPCWITGSGGSQVPCCKQPYRETHSVKKWVLLQTASEDSSQQPCKWAILAIALEATIKL